MFDLKKEPARGLIDVLFNIGQNTNVRKTKLKLKQEISGGVAQR